MWLLDTFLKSAIKRGHLIVTNHDGTTLQYGAPENGVQPLRIRLTHRKAANHIARYPQVGAGEAFMWGWLEVEEPHDIRDLVLFVTRNAKREAGASLKPKGPLRKAAQKLLAKADSVNLRGKARKNAEHTYNLTRELYERFLDCLTVVDTTGQADKGETDERAVAARGARPSWPRSPLAPS